MLGLSGVKAVIFDIDDTLFPSTDFARSARENAAKAMVAAGLEATEQEVLARLKKIVDKKGSNYGNHFDDLCTHFGCKEKAKVVASGIVAYHNTKASIQPFPEAISTLLELRDRGYYLAVASEGVEMKQWDKLIRLGLDHLFHKVFVTEEKRGGKTCAFYKSIIGKLKFKGGQILMVGNTPNKDIAPAKAAGMITCRVMVGWCVKAPGKPDFKINRLSQLLPLLPGN